MSQDNDQLQHDAELILSLYGNTRAQQQRLLDIEQQLNGQGVVTDRLHQEIEQRTGQQDPQLYRCSYQPVG